jgi:type IV pilus assembly protein PilC
MAEAIRKPRLGTFVWEGVDKKGRRLRGETQAISVAYVNASLRRQGINPLKVRRQRRTLMAGGRRVNAHDIAIFTRQLSTMIAAGVPIVQAFDVIAKSHDKPSVRMLLTSIRQDIEAGTNLTTALGKHPAHFDALYCNLVSAGEHAGVLDTMLDKIATYKERIEALKSKIKSALFYPTAVVVVAFIITSILLIFVIPQFEALFKGFGADLPAFTLFVIAVSRVFQDWWWLIFGALAGGTVFFIYSYKRSTALQHTFDRLVLRAPVVGEIVRMATIARYARTLSTMFSAGVPLIESLDSVAGAAGNRLYYQGVQEIKADVSTGMQLQAAMDKTGLFPNMVLQMVAIGEESGELDSMLGKVADFYEREVNDKVAALSSLLEPIIMVFLGVVVGGLVIAMYLPIFKLAAVV